MARPKHALLIIFWSEIVSLWKAIRLQKLNKLMIIAIIVFLFAVLFSFLTASPILSPFVYPLI